MGRPVQLFGEVDTADQVAGGHALAKVDGGFKQSPCTGHDSRIWTELEVGDVFAELDVFDRSAAGAGGAEGADMGQQPVEARTGLGEQPAIDRPRPPSSVEIMCTPARSAAPLRDSETKSDLTTTQYGCPNASTAATLRSMHPGWVRHKQRPRGRIR